MTTNPLADTPSAEETQSEPRVFGWVAGRPVSRQIHPDTNPEKKPENA